MRRKTAGLQMGLGLAAAILVGAAADSGQDADAYRSIETKYIFGDFTIGSSTDKVGDKEFELESQSDIGKRGGRYFANETVLEFEYAPTKYLADRGWAERLRLQHCRRARPWRPQHVGGQRLRGGY